LLSRALEMQCFSFASDDDRTESGLLFRRRPVASAFRFETDSLEIVWIDGRGVIKPLRFDADCEVADADLQELKSAVAAV